MKLVSVGPPGAERPAVLAEDGTVLPLDPLLARYGVSGDMSTVLGLLPVLGAEIAELARHGGPGVPPAEVRFGPPVPRPRQIVMLGANYRSHIAESAVSGGVPPSKPMLVGKAPSTLVGPGDDIIRPLETDQLDYEVELVVVIGRTGRRIPVERARGHIAGYLVANDVTAKDEMLGDFATIPFYLQLFRGKNFDTFLPTGPWLTTADEIADPSALRVWLSVNGEPRMDCPTKDMASGVDEVVAEVSSVVTLHPGDLILTGSPAGGGGDFDPPRYLRPGDVVRAGITDLGEIANTVVDEAGRG